MDPVEERCEIIIEEAEDQDNYNTETISLEEEEGVTRHFIQESHTLSNGTEIISFEEEDEDDPYHDALNAIPISEDDHLWVMTHLYCYLDINGRLLTVDN